MTARDPLFLAAHEGPTLRASIVRERLPAAAPPGPNEAEGEQPAAAGDEAAAAEEDAIHAPGAVDLWGEPGGVALPRSGADLGAVRVREGAAAPVSLAITYGEVAASCLDGIALAGRHRTLLSRTGRIREEERTLAFIDALAVTPRFPSALFAWWEEAVELVDPWKVWAPALVLACLDGGDVPAALRAILSKLSEDEDEAAVIAGEALALGARADRVEWARSFARDPHPPARAAGLEARSLLGALSAAEVVSVLSTDGARTVRWAAARAAARLPADPQVDELLLAELHRATDPELAWEVVRALALRGLPAGYFAMKHDPTWAVRLGPHALDVLALFGDVADAALARQVAARCGLTSRVLLGLGRFGHAGAAPLLLRALGDEDAAEDAGAALVWLFGLPMDEDEALSPAAWRAWIATADLDERVRYRFGRPYAPACLAEATRQELRSQADLAWLVDEANVRAGLAERPELWRWSPLADASLAPSLAALGRASDPFALDPWRSVGRERRRRA